MRLRRIGERRPRVLRPVLAGPAGAADYRRALARLIDEMFNSVAYWIQAAYRKAPPLTAQDALPAAELERQMARLRRRWEKRFDEAAGDLARHFARRAARRTDAQLASILKRGGLSVEFSPTLAQRDVLKAAVNENIQLIRSVPRHALLQVEGAVMRSIQTGRDLGSLTKYLKEQQGVTLRRAALIARDQNNKATAALTRARQIDLGLEEAIWQHSHAGKEPRPSHVRMDGKHYSIREGMWDDDEGRYVQPGEMINCRCTARPVVPGFA